MLRKCLAGSFVVAIAVQFLTSSRLLHGMLMCSTCVFGRRCVIACNCPSWPLRSCCDGGRQCRHTRSGPKRLDWERQRLQFLPRAARQWQRARPGRTARADRRRADLQPLRHSSETQAANWARHIVSKQRLPLTFSIACFQRTVNLAAHTNCSLYACAAAGL
jgi:hypothetical protein